MARRARPQTPRGGDPGGRPPDAYRLWTGWALLLVTLAGFACGFCLGWLLG